jgi:hypothetical protein
LSGNEKQGPVPETPQNDMRFWCAEARYALK